MPVTDIGIDLGTSNSLAFSTVRGIVLREPTIVIYDKNTEKIRAIGEEARNLSHHLTANLEVVRPIRQGNIMDYMIIEKLLKYFISKAMGARAFRKPRISICVPCGITAIERRALEEATYQAGAREVRLVDAPIAAAIGAGVDITRPFGNLVVDIGGGTTQVAVLSMAGTVVSNTIKIGGENFNQAIMSYVRSNHSLFISQDAAEEIKIRIGSAVEDTVQRTMEVKGRNIMTGLPKTSVLTSEDIRQAIREETGAIVEAVHSVLEKTPPELAEDIVNRGIVLTGGGAMLHGMDQLIEEKTGVTCMTVNEAMTVAVVGTGKYAQVLDSMDLHF